MYFVNCRRDYSIVANRSTVQYAPMFIAVATMILRLRGDLVIRFNGTGLAAENTSPPASMRQRSQTTPRDRVVRRPTVAQRPTVTGSVIN